jgi:hypothetical protein
MAEKLFGKMNAVGHTLGFGDRAAVTVAGVARNSKYFTIGEQGALAYHQPYTVGEAGAGLAVFDSRIR